MATFEVISAAAIGGGGSGGGVEILSASRTLTDEQIKALPSEFVQIVAAPGEGKILFPISAFLILNAVAAAYTNVNDSSFTICTDQRDNLSSYMAGRAGILDAARLSFGQFVFPYIQQSMDSIVGENSTSGMALADLENRAIGIHDPDLGSGNYTGGNEDNTLKVTLYYIEVTL